MSSIHSLTDQQFQELEVQEAREVQPNVSVYRTALAVSAGDVAKKAMVMQQDQQSERHRLLEQWSSPGGLLIVFLEPTSTDDDWLVRVQRDDTSMQWVFECKSDANVFYWGLVETITLDRTGGGR